MKVKVQIKKLHPDAVIPTYAKSGDAGLDLTAISAELYKDKNSIIYKTGLAIKIPEGHVGLLFPRSSIRDQELILSNCVGVIDSGYTGEISMTFKVTTNKSTYLYAQGDRVGQLLIIPYPQVEFEEVKELSKTERGEQGFGSSGN